MREVSGGLACAYPLLDKRLYALRLARREPASGARCGIVGRQSQRVEDQPGGFIARIRRAVTVGNSRGFKPPGGRVQGRA